MAIITKIINQNHIKSKIKTTSMLKYLILVCFICYSLQIEHCEKIQKICKTCIDGYTLVPRNDDITVCIKTTDYEAIRNVKEHCIKGDPEARICEECIRDYFLDEKNNCIESPHCLSFNYGHCVSCKKPYTNGRSNYTCVPKPYCDSLEGENCTQCQVLFYVDEKGNCRRIPDKHCLFGNSTSCESCGSGYYLNSELKCQEIPVEHCREGDSTGCEKCETPYHMEYGRCLPNPEHCRNIECSKCDSYFHPEGGKCVENIEHCIYYIDGYCSGCDEGYSLNNKECKYITIKNCLILEDDLLHCKTCKNGYFLNDDKTQCNDFCEEYEDSCDYCKDNYMSFDYGKTCVKIDPNIPDVPDDTDDTDVKPSGKSNFINLNLFIILLICIFNS